MNPWVEVISVRLGSPVLTTSDEVRFNCWRRNCGKDGGPDTKAHMYVNPRKGSYFCQRCRSGGSLDFLCKVLKLEAPGGSLLLWQKIVQEFMYGLPAQPPSEPVTLEDWTPVTKGTQAYAYLISRGISDKKQREYALGFGIDTLRDRIVMPDFDETGKLVYWVARDYRQAKKVDEEDPSVVSSETSKRKYARPRYKNATAPREFQLYNFGRIKAKRHKGRIFVTEGPISAQVVGYDAIATYGKHVTGSQVSMMVNWNPEEYIILGDGDARMEAVSLATRLLRRGQRVRIGRFYGNEDPASVGSQEARRRGLSATPWNDVSVIEELLDGCR